MKSECRFQSSICERYCSVTVTIDAASSRKFCAHTHKIAHGSVVYQFRGCGVEVSVSRTRIMTSPYNCVVRTPYNPSCLFATVYSANGYGLNC